jgi:hypothetical protein
MSDSAQRIDDARVGARAHPRAVARAAKTRDASRRTSAPISGFTAVTSTCEAMKGDGGLFARCQQVPGTAPGAIRRPHAPRPLKNLEVMNDEITTTAAGPEP